MKIAKNYNQKNNKTKNKTNLNCFAISMGFKHSTCDISTNNFSVFYVTLYFINIICSEHYYPNIPYGKVYKILEQLLFQCCECGCIQIWGNIKSCCVIMFFIKYAIHLTYAKAYRVLKIQMPFHCSKCDCKSRCETVKNSHTLMRFISFALNKHLMFICFRSMFTSSFNYNLQS